MLLYNDKFKIFQSTLSVRRATTVDVVTSPRVFISIHALREESDLNELFDGDTTYVISIHALREESDFLNKSVF